MKTDTRPMDCAEMVRLVVSVSVAPGEALATEREAPVPSQSKATAPEGRKAGRPFHRTRGEEAATKVSALTAAISSACRQKMAEPRIAQQVVTRNKNF